jgi:mono/diheme cytochrome c family protein
MRAAASTLIAGAALFSWAACGADGTPDRGPEQRPAERNDEAERLDPAQTAPSGKQLFVQRCGSCHTLADAGTTGTVGPNLDEHFGPHHMPHVREIRAAIRNGPGRMPAGRVRGRDARAVAKYLARATRD